MCPWFGASPCRDVLSEPLTDKKKTVPLPLAPPFSVVPYSLHCGELLT
jgi:hypothetical protein